jgi:cardiolipin synthase (CMP-forming)
MTTRALTPANQITILRLAFAPVFAILVVEQHYRAALVVVAAAALSDFLDGAVARLFHQQSPLGVALDPIADKTLMITAYLTLTFRGILPWWLTILVLSRDVGIIITALVISLVAGYRPFYPTALGKASTTAQVTNVLVGIGFGAGIPLMTRTVLRSTIYLAAALTVASGVHYLVVSRQRYSQQVADASDSGQPPPKALAAPQRAVHPEAETAKRR